MTSFIIFKQIQTVKEHQPLDLKINKNQKDHHHHTRTNEYIFRVNFPVIDDIADSMVSLGTKFDVKWTDPFK